MIVIFALLCKRLKVYMKKKKEEKALVMGEGEKVRHQRFDHKKAMVTVSKPVNYFRPKRSIQIVPLFKSDFSIDNLPIHPPPKITCIYTDTIVDYMRGKMPRKPDGLSLYSFDSAIFRAASPFSTISIISRDEVDDEDVSFGSESC